MDDNLINRLVALTNQWNAQIEQAAQELVKNKPEDAKEQGVYLGEMHGYEQCSHDLTALLTAVLAANGQISSDLEVQDQ
jgi:hypothetical protein